MSGVSLVGPTLGTYLGRSYLGRMKSKLKTINRHGPHTAANLISTVTHIQIINVLYITQFSYKRMFHFYRASVINMKNWFRDVIDSFEIGHDSKHPAPSPRSLSSAGVQKRLVYINRDSYTSKKINSHQKRPYTSRETCMHEKRPVYIKRDLDMSKETNKLQKRLLRRSFFLFWVVNTQLNHWTKRVVSARLTTKVSLNILVVVSEVHVCIGSLHTEMVVDVVAQQSVTKRISRWALASRWGWRGDDVGVDERYLGARGLNLVWNVSVT